MGAFTIGGNEKNQFSSGISFGSAQAMQKKQEDADAKKAEEKKPLSQGDTVSISEAAINKQLGRVEDNAEEKSTGNVSLDNLKKKVLTAEEAIGKINGSRENEDENDITKTLNGEGFKMEFKDTDMGGPVSRKPVDKKSEDEEVEEEEAEDKKVEEEEASSLEQMKQDINNQIQKRQADIRSATSDTSEEGQAKKQMLQAQLMALENTLTELEAKTDD